jgi:Flp pilus assembly protein CpaB
VSRRARAVAFGAGALICAGLAASLASGYRGSVEAQLGELRPVVVAAAEVRPGRALRPRDARNVLEVRQVPARFAPADALAEPLQAVGRVPRAAIPPGSYLTEGLLRIPGGTPRPRAEAAAGRDAVEIVVAGAGALAAAGDPIGRRYDVVATGEPRAGGGGGRTRLVASGVELLGLEQSRSSAGGLEAEASSWTATLAADRAETLRLIQAHNYAREVRLITAAR